MTLTPITDEIVDRLIPDAFLPQELIDSSRRFERDRASLIATLNEARLCILDYCQPIEKGDEVDCCLDSIESLLAELEPK